MKQGKGFISKMFRLQVENVNFNCNGNKKQNQNNGCNKL